MELKFCMLFVCISLGHIRHKTSSSSLPGKYAYVTLTNPYTNPHNPYTISYTTKIFPQDPLSTLNNSILPMLCQFVSPEQPQTHMESSDHSPSMQVSALIVMKYSLIPLKSRAHSSGFCTLWLGTEKEYSGHQNLIKFCTNI